MFDFYFNIVFVLLPWCKSTKKSRLRLLSYSVTAFRCARRKLAALRQRRSGRFTSFLRLTLTRTRPIQWIIENYLFFSLIYQWYRFRDGRGAALLRLITSFHNQMETNKIMNEFIMLFVVLSCRVTRRRSTLRLYIHFLLPLRLKLSD